MNKVTPKIFILCGLPMCGNTTILNCLAYILNAGIVSGSLRPVARKLGIEDKGEQFNDFVNSNLAGLIDPINDRLLVSAAKLCVKDYKLCVLESKPGARFRFFKSDENHDERLDSLDFGQNSFAIFLHSSEEVIRQRAERNGRLDDLEKQKARMKNDNERYFKNYHYKPYEEEFWSKYVDLAIDNEDLSVGDTLRKIFEAAKIDLNDDQLKRLNELEGEYGQRAEKAKEVNEKLVAKLKSLNLYFDPDWISDNVIKELQEIYGITKDDYQSYF